METLAHSDIAKVELVDPCTVIIELFRNVGGELLDTSNIFLQVNRSPTPNGNVAKVPLTRTILNKLLFAKRSAYYAEFDKMVFCLPERRIKHLALSKNSLFLAADFNNWFEATKNPAFQLHYTFIDNSPFFAVQVPRASLPDFFQFKFVTSSGEWVGPAIDSPNVSYSANNIQNFAFSASKTGDHMLAMRSNSPLLLSDRFELIIGDAKIPVDPSPWLLSLYSSAELGSIINDTQTTFRIFLPRAHSARVLIYRSPNDSPEVHPLHRNHDYTWETTINKNLYGFFYHFQALFFDQTDWSTAPKILDPYAKATLSPAGPAMVVHPRSSLPLRDNFHAQHIKDDVIMEVHARDLIANVQIGIDDNQPTSFNKLTKWVAKKNCYLRKLGINAIELQPIQEPDAPNKSAYHWGYMPVNYFSPASIYTSSPKYAQQELKTFVRACHRANIAVILDVVYNHVGNPNHLYNIDPDYFFRKNVDGSLQNFSGCGNDLRTESPMVQRLIIDSLKYFITTFHVDGFRFDLAELLGREFLHQLEHELRLISPNIQLIYEPWSFRNNIGHQLHFSSASAWNDEFREFVKDYVQGNGNFDGIKYFLRGSLGFRSNFPAQSVNYIASHDDLCWIDKITERQNHDGSYPTPNDVKRTHLALTILLMSLGVPMLAAGQDMLLSKHGNNNTYQNGDANALDYSLLTKHASTHKFFKNWIRFRLSNRGAVTRLLTTPTDKYMRFFRSDNSSAIGVLYNADRSLSPKQVFFAINPHNYSTNINLENFSLSNFRKLSDADKFFRFSKKFSDAVVDNRLILPPLSLGLWIE